MGIDGCIEFNFDDNDNIESVVWNYGDNRTYDLYPDINYNDDTFIKLNGLASEREAYLCGLAGVYSGVDYYQDIDGISEDRRIWCDIGGLADGTAQKVKRFTERNNYVRDNYYYGDKYSITMTFETYDSYFNIFGEEQIDTIISYWKKYQN